MVVIRIFLHVKVDFKFFSTCVLTFVFTDYLGETRILRIRCVACFKCIPFDIKKEKKKNCVCPNDCSYLITSILQ